MSRKNTYVFRIKQRTCFLQKERTCFFKSTYNDRGDSLKQAITHILMKEKERM